MTDLRFTRLTPDEGTDPLLTLYRRAIDGIDEGLYSEAQKRMWRAWASVPEVADRLLREGITLLATQEGRLQGFAQLMPDSHINMLYVDPASSRRGVGSALIRAMERIARHQSASRLHTSASHASRALFQRAGFVAKGPDSIQVSTDVCIDRTVMIKDLRISRR